MFIITQQKQSTITEPVLNLEDSNKSNTPSAARNLESSPGMKIRIS